jgi:hypothetical protein
MGGLSGRDKTQSMAGLPDYFNSSQKYGGGRGTNTWGTGYSTMNYGNVTIDPSIRSIQEQNLSKNNNLYNELGTSGQNILGDLQGLRSSYQGNMSAYDQARVNPLEQELTSQQGQLQQSIGMRGLAGSSFGDQAMTNFAIDKQRSLGDARALAQNENLQALTGIDAQMANTLFQKVSQQAALTGMDAQTARDRLQQELSALGLGTQQQQLMINEFDNFQNRAMQNRQAIASDVLGGFSGAKGSGGSSSWGSTGSNYNSSYIGSNGYSPSME